MEAVLLLIMGAVNILCFMIGAKVGQAVQKGEKIELPTVNPMDMVREHREKKEAENEKSRMDTIMSNIDAYDGTGRWQSNVPGGE